MPHVFTFHARQVFASALPQSSIPWTALLSGKAARHICFQKKTHTLEDFGCHSKLCPSLTQFENPLLPNTLTRIGSRRRTEYLGTSCKFEHPLNFTEDYHYCYYHFFGKGLASKHCLKTLWKYRWSDDSPIRPNIAHNTHNTPRNRAKTSFCFATTRSSASAPTKALYISLVEIKYTTWQANDQVRSTRIFLVRLATEATTRGKKQCLHRVDRKKEFLWLSDKESAYFRQSEEPSRVESQDLGQSWNQISPK